MISKPIIPDYAPPRSYAPFIQRSQSRLGICLLIRAARWPSIARNIAMSLAVLLPPLVMLSIVYLISSSSRWRGGSNWSLIVLAIMAAAVVSWHWIFTINRGRQSAIIELRAGRLIIRDSYSFNDWPVDQIISIRAESKAINSARSGYGYEHGDATDLIPRPHLAISVNGRNDSRMLYQYSMLELESIAQAIREEINYLTKNQETSTTRKTLRRL